MADGDGAAGGGGEKWQESLPENVRSWEEATNSDTSEKFWDQIANHRAHLGQSIRVPGDDASKEDWDAFHSKLINKVPNLIPRPSDDGGFDALYRSLGRPEKEDGYTIPSSDNPDIDITQSESFRAIALKHGLNQKQFEGIINDVREGELTKLTASRETALEANKGLETEWGAAFEQNRSAAILVAERTNAPPEIIAAIKSGAIGPNSLKWLHSLSQKFAGEGAGVGGDVNRDAPTMTPDEAAMMISEMMSNKEHPYWKKDDVGHKAAKRKMRELIILKQGGKVKPRSLDDHSVQPGRSGG